LFGDRDGSVVNRIQSFGDMFDLLIDSILKLQPHDGFGDFSGKTFAGRF
jgi:hypothetical protein